MHENMGRDLVTIIDRYLTWDSGRSLTSLAKDAGVGYTTIRRLAQGECVPNQETALAIIDVALAFPEKVAFLKKYYPRMGKIVSEASPTDDSNVPDAGMLRRFLQKEVHNLIFNLANTQIGTDEQQVSRVAGEKGIQALNDLLNADILRRGSDGRVRFPAPHKIWMPLNVRDLLLQFRHSVAHFDKSLVGTDAARLLHITGAVNAPTLKKINGMAKGLGGKVLEIKDSEKSRGNIPFFLDLLMNIYDKEKYRNAI